MLNRYGLVDIDKILREQDEEQPAGPPPPEEAPPEEAPAGGEAPPPEPEEDPDEKIDAARQKGGDEDLVDFRRKHADLIFRIAKNSDPMDYGRNMGLQSLRQKFEDSGVDRPFFMAFDPQTSGLSGRQHLSLIASMHHRGRVSGDKIRFLNAGDASEFAEKAPEIRDDLAFEVMESDPMVVQFKQAEQEEEPEGQPEMGPQPPA